MQAVADAVGDAEDLPEEWHELPVYTVGETTARLAKEMLNIDSVSASNAAALASQILKSKLF